MKTRSLKSFFIVLLLFSAFPIMAKIKSPVALYPNGAPEKNGITQPEKFDGHCISNVTEASLTIYYPKGNNTGASLLICPGGGYSKEAVIHEGYQFAEWLSTQGITAFVLKYRLPNGHKDIPLKDVKQAMIYLRDHATELEIDPHKIGISGFSAGGHLAATGGTKLTDASSRPDYMVLFYPVVTLKENLTHKGTLHSLLGEKPSNKEIDEFSADKQITSQTPPTILFLSDDDKTVNPINSILFYEGLKQQRIPASLNIYPIGGHGWGFHPYFEYHEIWKSQLLKWMKDMNLMK